VKNTGKPGALILGGDFQGLGVIRSLSEQGVQVFLVEYEWSISRYSRYVRRRAFKRDLLSGGRFAEYLIELAKEEKLEGWVVYPNNDEIVKELSVNREELGKYYRIPVPPWDVVRKFYVKKEAYEVAEKLSIPIPRMYRGKGIEDILSQEPRFPLVLKPSFKENYFPRTRKKAVRVDTRKELIEEFRKMSEFVEPELIVVQEMIEGGPKNLYSYVVLFDGERVVAGMAARRSRQHPMDFGQATTFAESVNLPEIGEMASALLKEIGYFGLAEVEFMRDEKDGCFKFIEINGRPWGWHTLAKASGLNLPYLLFRLMVGEPVQNGLRPEIGVKWVRWITDVPTVAKEIISGRMSISEYIESLKGKREYAVFSMKDPLPFLMEYVMIPYLWWRRGF